jgi:hypothetical protein
MSIDDDLGYASEFLLGLRQTFERIRAACPDDLYYLDTHVSHLSKYTEKCEELLHNLINQRRLRQS